METANSGRQRGKLKKKYRKERQINTNTNRKARRAGWPNKLNTAFVLAASVSCWQPDEQRSTEASVEERRNGGLEEHQRRSHPSIRPSIYWVN